MPPPRQFLLHEELIGRKGGHRTVGHRQAQLVFDPGQIARFASQGRQQLGARLFQAHDQRAGGEGRRIFQALIDGLFDPDPGRLQLRVLAPEIFCSPATREAKCWSSSQIRELR